MFTNLKSVLATLGAALALEATAFAQESPLPRPPLQPMPKEFKVPRPNLGVPDGIPVAQESAPARPNPLPEKPFVAPPDPNRGLPRTLPQPPSIPGPQPALDDVAVTQNVRVNGKVHRVDQDRVIVESNTGKELVLHVDPKTEYLRREPAAGYAALVPGAQFAAVYEQRGEKLWITAIDIARADEVRPVKPVAVVPAAVSPYESEIVRVVGPDQIVVRNLAGVEFPVYTTDDTRFLFGDTIARFSDLRPGMRIRIDDELRAEQRFARRILGIR
jgi:hypothetical protein